MRFLLCCNILWSLLALLWMLDFCASMDSLNQTRPMRENNTLISAGRKFELGFFSTDNSSKRYLGIWFYNIPIRTIVWVANRNKPLDGSPGILKIEHGNLVIQDNSGRAIWSSSTQNLSSSSIIGKLLDSGNLILKYDNSESYLWQSFDHPTDTMLAGMKVGWDFKAGIEWQLTSWKSADDPSLGQLSFRMDSRGLPQAKMFERNITRFRTFSYFGIGHSSLDSVLIPIIVYNSQEVYYSYDLRDQNTLLRYLANYTGKLQHYMWDNQALDWVLLYENPSISCDEYAECGPNAVCDTVDTIKTCKCLPGYVPKSAQDSDTLNLQSSAGCTRKRAFNCSVPEGFKRVKQVKLPDILQFEMNSGISIKECEKVCLRNCTCTAYAIRSDHRNRTGCGFWFGDLFDMREVHNDYYYTDLFIRVMASEQGSTRKKWVIVVAVALSTSFLMFCFCASWRRGKHRGVRLDVDVEEENLQLPIFDAVMISQATNDFSNSNKIGEGGFGPVYKGQLPNGQEIAVKRLSETSRQGLNEFKNEVMLIAKLQHRNLVKLLGCCIEGDERMLVYEYMPHGSLDSFIFSTKGSSLAWRRRFNIIVGVAKGILYLHQDSRLRIIHRDLKADNVLLDIKMNPKISDFGMARTFGEDQFLAKTRRVVGTFGYMSPEYAIDGIFSIKSDVFSFGVLVLEIVCGKRNREFHHADHHFNLLGHAWKLWVEGKAYELIDEQMKDSFPLSEVMRCIQVALLCVQKCPDDRPTMSSVLLMLDSESATILQPKEPGFYLERIPDGKNIIVNGKEYSVSKISVTQLEGR